MSSKTSVKKKKKTVEDDQKSSHENNTEENLIPNASQPSEPKSVNFTSEERSTNQTIGTLRNVSRVGWVDRIEYATEQIDEDRCMEKILRSAQDSTGLLSTTLGTVLLLATKASGISDERLLSTENYLTAVTNENGNHLHNVDELLKYIRFMRNARRKK